MTADFTTPAVTQTEANYALAIRELLTALALGLDTTISNTPTGAIRWSATNSRWEKFNGTSWAALVSKYLIDVDTLDSLHAADLALVGHNHAATYQALHANLTAMAALSLIADRLPYANGSGTLALTTLTAAGRALIDDANASAQRITLGLAIGTDVQAFHANLTALAGLSLIADRLPYANGTGTLSLATLTAAGRALLDDASASAQRTTLGLTALASLTLTANRIIYIGSAGTPQQLALGAAGTVLTSGGATSAPTFTELATGFPPNYITGLGLRIDTDTDHDIEIGIGSCRDSTDAYDMALAAVLTKCIDASWAAGDDAGGMDTGSVANSTYYYIWLIRKDSDGSIDALFSASATAPTMPAGYTYKRVIGRLCSGTSANINPNIIISANPAIGGVEIWTTAESTRAFIKPPWPMDYDVEVQGGGGGGGGSDITANGAGGGGGAYSRKRIHGQAAATSTTVTVGGGGGGGASAGNGSAGNTSSFGTLVSCTGGGAGQYNGNPGAGGVATGGDFIINGQRGSLPVNTGTSAGGNSGMGLGGYSLTQANGTAGTGYGSGGSGAVSSGSCSGGAGCPGLVRITF